MPEQHTLTVFGEIPPITGLCSCGWRSSYWDHEWQVWSEHGWHIEDVCAEGVDPDE